MKKRSKCWILRGYPGSGKSTFAETISKEESAVIVSADNFWIDSFGKYNFDASKLKLAHQDCFDKFKEAVLSGRNVIVDNTNLKYDDAKKYLDFLVTNNNLNETIYSVVFKEISYNDIEKAISLRTNREDGKNIPEDKMRMMHRLFKNDIRHNILSDFQGKIGLNDLDELTNELPWKNDPSKIPAIICDLDGTLSIFEYTNGYKIRNPYDGDKCGNDFIYFPVAEALKAFYYIGYKIIFVSGREDKFRKQTEEFLERVVEEHSFEYEMLLMRKSGDYRKDFIVKEEIFNLQIKNSYNVISVFDDRKSVVEMWRRLGLFVFDCNYRSKDF